MFVSLYLLLVVWCLVSVDCCVWIVVFCGSLCAVVCCLVICRLLCVVVYARVLLFVAVCCFG